MKSRLVKVGNSKGVIIPASFIKECHLENEIEMEIFDNGIFIKSINHSRSGWEQSFKELSKKSRDKPAEEFPLTDFDHVEWQW